MQYKQMRIDTHIPVIGLGTWKMGGALEADYSQDKQHIAAIQHAISLGMTHIDTAEKYGAGHSEELVGKAIKGIDRSSLFITTKLDSKNCAYDSALQSMETSLERLGTDYVDLYLIHSPSPTVPLQETMQAMDRFVDEGKARFIGVSNFSVAEMKEAQQHTKHGIAANQIEYNLFVRNGGQFTSNMESEIIPYCQKNNILIIAYRPLVKGILTQQHTPVLDQLAIKYGKTPAQIALQWLVSKPQIVTIVKSSHADHLNENADAANVVLDANDIELLDSLTIAS